MLDQIISHILVAFCVFGALVFWLVEFLIRNGRIVTRQKVRNDMKSWYKNGKFHEILEHTNGI